MFQETNGALEYYFDHERVRVEAWGENALRVRATKNGTFTGRTWALDEKDASSGKVEIFLDERAAGGAFANMYEGKNESRGSISNGKIKAEINAQGVITFTGPSGKKLFREHSRRLQDAYSMALSIPAREYRRGVGDNMRLQCHFESDPEEKIFGMGQYQQHQMNMKGCVLELAQRNSQVSVPFYISDQGYGFLWNNPGVGEVVFGKNETKWSMQSSKEIDYLVIAGDTPSEIGQTYMQLTGLPPMMPEYGMGFWQCKLRYRTQEELLTVARKYHQLGIPLDVIVADFFHWTKQGEYRFDPEDWPDVPAMTAELEQMGIRLMVSVWPTVDVTSENYPEMMEKGYLAQTDAGVRLQMLCGGNEIFFDATNPDARAFVWSKIKANYWDQGARLYWLDVAEPEYTSYDFASYRYQLGSDLEVGNLYPKLYLKGFYDGMTAEGDPMPLSLIRSAWAGSAKYGALVWSGDIVSSFECFDRQVKAGLSMAVAGIPWWTTDIGGFHGARGDDPAFRELFARWFAYGAFCPVMRLHGNRNPQKGYGATKIGTGSDNEIWSFGDEIFGICKKYIQIREQLRPYTRSLMQEAHEKGTPVMRPLFYEFPEDENAWNVEDAYMYGPDLLVAPVLKAGAAEREVYLPAGCSWQNFWTGEEAEGGQTITTATPIDTIPVFCKVNK